MRFSLCLLPAPNRQFARRLESISHYHLATAAQTNGLMIEGLHSCLALRESDNMSSDYKQHGRPGVKKPYSVSFLVQLEINRVRGKGHRRVCKIEIARHCFRQDGIYSCTGWSGEAMSRTTIERKERSEEARW